MNEITELEERLLQAIDNELPDVSLLALATVLHAVAMSIVEGDEAKVAKLYQNLADRTREATGERGKLH